MAAGMKTLFVCSQCGYESKKWLGKCPSCNEWNSFAEETVREKKAAPTAPAAYEGQQAVMLDEVAREDFPRTSTQMAELDRVLGGGVVAGSLILIGGDPGIGKSTLLLQAAYHLARQGGRVLYVSGEESVRQVAMRATRLSVRSDRLYLQAQTNLDHVLEQIKRLKPDFVVVDSIQTMYRDDVGSAPGSVTQVRECTALLMQTAKSTGCSIFLVGHVTKAGA
ncbi:MAG: AAA family ATPase, partial [Christensenellaceae bacterium]